MTDASWGGAVVAAYALVVLLVTQDLLTLRARERATSGALMRTAAHLGILARPLLAAVLVAIAARLVLAV